MNLPAKTSNRPRRGRHLRSLRAIRHHVANSAKHEAYETMLRDYGISTSAFAALRCHPRLVYAEQPGCWFYAEDLLRARLLEALLGTGEFHPSSGVLSLGLDAFSDRGVKRWFTTFQLASHVDEVHLLGSTYRRRHRHRTYDALPVDRPAHDRLDRVFSTAADMLEAARISPKTFADELSRRFRAGPDPGVRPMLPRNNSRKSLTRLASKLRDYDLEAALRTLAVPCWELRRGRSWSDYWNAVNSQFFQLPISPLGDLYNRFLLTVEDPDRLASALAEDLRRSGDFCSGRDLPIAAIITDDDKYRMACLDAAAGDLYYLDGCQRRRQVSWQDVRRLAEAGRTGGPPGVLAYLLMAASGIYLVSDTVDGDSPFERAARRIHALRTGLTFPSISLPAQSGLARGGLLQIYTRDFEARCQAALEQFLD